ncbi:MAG: hypothetical protein U5P10_14410 [Spirochaetia bacterium]|nr:hypothetical protein [Spirochaetia bacterium]
MKIGQSENLALQLIDQGLFIERKAGCGSGQELAVVLKVSQLHAPILPV